VAEKKESLYPKVSYDEFFTSQEERDLRKLEYVQDIPINEITNFPNHPYKVRDDDKMFETMESIIKYGVLHPAIIRPKENGGYEMISGHRRKRACELAKIKEMPCIVRNLTDDEATILMVDSNLQRENILPSEKAFAYRMRLEAMKRQAGRPKKDKEENSVQVAQNLKGKTSREILAEQVGESQDSVRRYIRLTYLIPELLQLVDNQYLKDKNIMTMAFMPAVEISYLRENEQYHLLDAIECLEATPSHAQARILREKSEKGELTSEDIDEILSQEKPNQKEQIKFKVEKVRDYFPKGYSIEQMQATMTKLLEKYKTQWQNKQRDYAR